MKDIIIIGAGIAGVTTAKTIALLKRILGRTWPEVTVLEAKGDIGGRVAGKVGAKWLHGGDINPLAPLVKSYGFAYHRENETFLFPQDEMNEESFVKMEMELERTAMLSGNMHEANIMANSSMRHRQVAEALIANCDFGLSMRRISPSEYMEATYAESGIIVDAGMQPLLKAFAQNISEQIITSCPVTEISENKSGIQIACANGRSYTAMKVIVTSPVMVLKEGGIKLNLKLPPEYFAAMDSFSRSSLSKIELEMDAGFFLRHGIEPDTFLFHLPDEKEATLSALNQGGKPNILLFFGEESLPFIQNKSTSEIARYAINRLEEHFGDEVASYVKNIHYHNWMQDAYALTAYPFTINTNNRRILAEPTLNGRIIFAGEHVITDGLTDGWHTQMAGAFLSGIRAGVEAIFGQSKLAINSETNRLILYQLLLDELTTPGSRMHDLKLFLSN